MIADVVTNPLYRSPNCSTLKHHLNCMDLESKHVTD
jgi:hypothetical protein